MLFGIHTQGVASLALGYALVGLSARPCLNQGVNGYVVLFIPRVSLRLPLAMRLLGFLALASGKAERSPH